MRLIVAYLYFSPSSFSTSEEGLALEEKIWGEMVELWKSLEPEAVNKVVG